ncbi:Beta-glucuronosyltransferase GlcAT14B [Vitis vinifera]|uniref:Beta-glucuronosyltransferase GlcAT14B n=1 Tax=Vitis vinifera TaxID=29760 RepID=A0A438DEF9_VITVI|nr:Beta-glucuronosyltransferase GlcAT14B [Vitis vinifera]
MYYTNVLSSPEGYFHTVICNHKDYQNTTVNHDLHYIRWDNPPKQHPITLTVEHFNDMVNSGAPFARKFAKDDPVLNKIDKELLKRLDGQFTPGGLNSVNSSVMPQIVPKNFVQSSLEHGPGTNSCKIHGFKNIHGIAAFVKPSVMG